MKVSKKIKQSQQVICNWCGQPTSVIWVHGHGQCKLCGINIEECCRGEHCENQIPPIIAEKMSHKN